MGTWGTNWTNVSYALGSSGYSNREIFKYTNTSGNVEKINSITMPMGTGNTTYTAGNTVTGNGAAINFYVDAWGDSNQRSSTAVVTKTVGRKSSSSGYYPPRDQMENYTVSFSMNVLVNPGATIVFTYASNASQSSNSVFVFDSAKIDGSTSAYNPTSHCIAPSYFSTSDTVVNPGGQSSFNWGGASGGTNNGIARFYVQRKLSSDGWWGSGDPANPSDTGGSGWTTQNIPWVEAATYNFQIRTEGTAGEAWYSGFCGGSNVITRGPPSAPSNVGCSQSGLNIYFSWTENSHGYYNNLNRYEVNVKESTSQYGTYYAFGSYNVGGNTNYTFTGGTAGRWYKATITKFCTYSSATSGESGASRKLAPNPTITSLTVSNVNYAAIVTYTDSVTGLSTYLLDFSGSGGPTNIRNLNIICTGTNADHFNFQYSVWSPNLNPTVTTPDRINWVNLADAPTTHNSSFYLIQHPVGSWIQWRARAVNVTDAVSGWMYSNYTRFGGSIKYKHLGNYGITGSHFKVAGVYRPISMVWYKVGGTWRRNI